MVCVSKIHNNFTMLWLEWSSVRGQTHKKTAISLLIFSQLEWKNPTLTFTFSPGFDFYHHSMAAGCDSHLTFIAVRLTISSTHWIVICCADLWTRTLTLSRDRNTTAGIWIRARLQITHIQSWKWYKHAQSNGDEWNKGISFARVLSKS